MAQELSRANRRPLLALHGPHRHALQAASPHDVVAHPRRHHRRRHACPPRATAPLRESRHPISHQLYLSPPVDLQYHRHHR